MSHLVVTLLTPMRRTSKKMRVFVRDGVLLSSTKLKNWYFSTESRKKVRLTKQMAYLGVYRDFQANT